MADVPGSRADDVFALDAEVARQVVAAHQQAGTYVSGAGEAPGGDFGEAAPYIAAIAARIGFGTGRLAGAHRTFAERADIATQASLAFDYQTREAFANLEEKI